MPVPTEGHLIATAGFYICGADAIWRRGRKQHLVPWSRAVTILKEPVSRAVELLIIGAVMPDLPNNDEDTGPDVPKRNQEGQYHTGRAGISSTLAMLTL